jgi:hypothetical protein
MTVIEIRPDRRGWKVFESPGVVPVFMEKRQAIVVAITPPWTGHNVSHIDKLPVGHLRGLQSEIIAHDW